ncbi:hypothetical protein RBH26_21180 [Natronolimnohabitans sp. A-GB9]|uniref:hypothetical protein n=1 Tax=Natronolimnohabitans sp. A-GB9 TaxID=3069757 RepID=UPI0027B48B54|nr:hypothetical protein [Natronolimnohabitans sp. A-GB9]MDQ2052959.1 hypothetical protein [Natronolimnohabitans sp. A-GB9]
MNSQKPHRYNRKEMPVFLKDMRDNIEGKPETFVFDLEGDEYRYIVTNDESLKEMIRGMDESLIFRQANDNIAISSSQALIARIPGDFQCL